MHELLERLAHLRVAVLGASGSGMVSLQQRLLLASNPLPVTYALARDTWEAIRRDGPR